jgi:hypothetical protein
MSESRSPRNTYILEIAASAHGYKQSDNTCSVLVAARTQIGHETSGHPAPSRISSGMTVGNSIRQWSTTPASVVNRSGKSISRLYMNCAAICAATIGRAEGLACSIAGVWSCDDSWFPVTDHFATCFGCPCTLRLMVRVVHLPARTGHGPCLPSSLIKTRSCSRGWPTLEIDDLPGDPVRIEVCNKGGFVSYLTTERGVSASLLANFMARTYQLISVVHFVAW